MSTRSRRGTTLIELVVALAVFAVFLYMAVSMAGTALSRTAAQREVLTVQAAFRGACDAIVQDARRASWPNVSSVDPVSPSYSGTDANPDIIAPLDGSLDSQLAVTLPILSTSGTYVMHVYRYYLATGSAGAQYVARADYTVKSTATGGVPFDDWDPAKLTALDGSPIVEPITATLTQLTRVYFVNRGGTVTIVFVATVKSGGVRDVTYSSNLFVRNYSGPSG